MKSPIYTMYQINNGGKAMNILKITKNQFWELEQLRKNEFDNPEDAVLCKCEKCGGAVWAYKTIVGKDGYINNGMNCPCGGRNRKVDKVEII